MTFEQWITKLDRMEAARTRMQEISPTASDEEIIATAAEYLIAIGPYHGSKWHLSVLDADQTLEHDWRYKNVRGITTTDEARARRWISECMRRGYAVVRSQRKRWTGGGPGSIKNIREHAQQRQPQCLQQRSPGTKVGASKV
jgi:hypothetical protein